ncbi:hypothetical protein V5799_033757, partial [Amblyomma americanum]
MRYPRLKKLPILGLGGSVGTGHKGVIAKVFVVDSFSELQKYRHQLKGKIVVFNERYTSYEETVRYRLHGPSAAAKVGAVAALVRSVTPLSIASPHGGNTEYTRGVRKIPAAAITVEDAELLKRLQERGITPVVKLVMDAKFQTSTFSLNTVAEIKGHSLDDEGGVFWSSAVSITRSCETCGGRNSGDEPLHLGTCPGRCPRSGV